LISDVVWSKRYEYHYDVWRVTKAGRPYERGGQTWLTPSSRIRITHCKDVLPEETERQCAGFRGDANALLEGARDRGDIDHLIKWVQERAARSF
jgi:hypothetical protein